MPAHSRSLSGTTEPIGQALDKPRGRKPRDLPRWSGLAAHLNLSLGEDNFPAGRMHFLTGRYSCHAVNRRQDLTDRC